MASRIGDVSMSSTIDFEGLQRRLTDAENSVFNAHREGIVAAIKDQWTGWLYAGRARGADRLVSHAAWSSRLQTTESRAVLLVFNHARSRGKAYAGYIHRAGVTTLEKDVVWAKLGETLLPALKRDLVAAVRRTLVKPGKPQRLAGKSTASRARRTRER